MKSAQRIEPATGTPWRAREAWTAFWQEGGQSRCVDGAPSIWHSLRTHWSAFAEALPVGARVLDLGCGAGAVARLLLAARADLHLTGIDFARVPLTLQAQLELLSETPMESLPFADASFGAVVSQFGFEYGDRPAAARELARIAGPGAPIAMLVHHADSAIVASNSVRLAVLRGFLAAPLRTAFCSGDAGALDDLMSELVSRHPSDDLIVELARSLPSRLERAQRERLAIWKALEEALAPERCLAESLQQSCVSPAGLDAWLAPLRTLCTLQPVMALREPDGTPIAWRITGAVGMAAT